MKPQKEYSLSSSSPCTLLTSMVSVLVAVIVLTIAFVTLLTSMMVAMRTTTSAVPYYLLLQRETLRRNTVALWEVFTRGVTQGKCLSLVWRLTVANCWVPRLHWAAPVLPLSYMSTLTFHTICYQRRRQHGVCALIMFSVVPIWLTRDCPGDRYSFLAPPLPLLSPPLISLSLWSEK